MDSDTYPGKGLSLAQLVFALNKELNRSAHLPLVTYDHDVVSQLERDISTVLISVRELKNTFAPINRVPLDVLYLIPTYLPSQRDVFRATFVCRHWRRTFLQHAALWSQLYTRKGGDYVTTLLKRTKGSALDVVIDHGAPPNNIAPLLPYVQQIRHLQLPRSYVTEILAFSQLISGPLPFLRSLEICVTKPGNLIRQVNTLAVSSPLLLSGATNLEQFSLELDSDVGLLNSFVFPNLTTLKLHTTVMVCLNASDLFDFLNASPKLRTVEVRIDEEVEGLEDVPRELVVRLPNVETFSLYACGTERQVYESAVHISCPRAKYTSLGQDIWDNTMENSKEVFPDPDSSKAIVRQYSTRSPVEEVTLEIDGSDQFETLMTWSLTFKSADAAVIRLGFDLGESGEELDFPHDQLILLVFTQACQTIQCHPQLSHIRRLHIKNQTKSFSFGVEWSIPMAGALQELFGSLGPLDELAVHGFDLRMLLPESGYSVLPPVKDLTIARVSMVDEEIYNADAIVELARSQHELEKPFERVKIHAWAVPVTMEERLGRWVDEVDLYTRYRATVRMRSGL